MKKIPLLLIILRLVLAPIVIFIAFKLKQEGRLSIIILMYLGLFSDIFDGIIARKLNVQTEKLRRLDSQIDLVFWIAIGVSVWILYPELIKQNSIFISLIFIMEALCYAISFIKFGKETCTHALISKLWGITLVIAFTSLIGFNYAGIPFYTCIVIGLLSHLDVILIILLLPKWDHDIPSFYHALQIRKGIPIKRNKLFN